MSNTLIQSMTLRLYLPFTTNTASPFPRFDANAHVQPGMLSLPHSHRDGKSERTGIELRPPVDDASDEAPGRGENRKGFAHGVRHERERDWEQQRQGQLTGRTMDI